MSDTYGSSRIPAAEVYPEEPTTAGLGRHRLGTFASYEDAQRMVDQLSDAGMDVSSLQIVGCDLRTVEQVTGRLTTGRAALLGAANGAWFGLFVGVLFALFSPAIFGPIIVGVLVGALFGALSGGLAHAALRGKRDFTSVQGLVADRYEVLVGAERAAEAQQLLARR